MGVARGVVDTGLVSLILQKTVYLLVFAWPLMVKGNESQENEGGTDSVESA